MKKLALGIAFVVGGSAVSLTQVSAVAVNAKPTKPVISVISSKSRGIKGKVDVTVAFQAAVTNSKSPLQLTEVRIGSFTCRSLLKATRCTVRNVPTTRTLKVDARSKNKNGFGPRSLPVSFKPTNRKVWRRQDLIISPVATVPANFLPSSQISNSVLKFNLNSTVGLALAQTVSSASVRAAGLGSNLRAIGLDGKVTDAVASGTASVRRFLIAPNNKLYIEFADSPVIDGAPCRLAVVNVDSGSPTCVEPDTGFVFMGARQDPNGFCNCTDFRPLRNDLQFDSQGSIYYAGVPGTWKQNFPQARGVNSCWNNSCSFASVIRRSGDGSLKDFGNSALEAGLYDEIDYEPGSQLGNVIIRRPIDNFLTLPDGRVLTYQHEIIPRPDGTCNTAPRCHDVSHFMQLWAPDGSKVGIDLPKESVGLLALVGANQAIIAAQNSLQLIDVRTGELGRSTIYRTSENTSFGCREESDDPRFIASRKDFTRFFCDSTSLVRHYWRTPNNELYLIMGQDRYAQIESYNRDATRGTYNDWVDYGAKYGSGVLIRAFPTVAATKLGKPTSDDELSRIEVFASALDRIFATGLNRKGERQTVMYNTSTDTTRVLIPVASKIRPDHLAYSAKINSLLFSGVYEDSGEVVNGVVDVTTGKLTILATKSSLDSLQAFAS